MKKKILFVSTRIDSPPTSSRPKVITALKGYLEGIDAEVDGAMLEDLTYVVVNGKPTILTSDGRDLAEYDIAYIKNWRAAETSATALTVYLQANGCRVICSELNHFRVTDKISEALLFAVNGISYPDTIFTIRSANLPAAIDQQSAFEYPLVVKAINGSAGEDNYLVDSRDELVKITEQNPTLQFMAQNMIENDGDHRILMMGFEPKLSFKRSRADDSTHLNNTSQGASAVLTKITEYSDEILADCVKVCQLVRREIAGVDVLINKHTGKHVILEVNASPQLSTGAFLDEKRAMVREYFEQELKK